MATVPSTKPVKKGQLQTTLLSLFPKKPHQKADLSDVTGAAVSSSLEGENDFVARAVGGAVEAGTAQAVKTEERTKTRGHLRKYGKSVSFKEKATVKRRQVAAGHCARKRSCRYVLDVPTYGGRYVSDEAERESGSDVDESEGESDDSYESSFIDDSDDDDGSDDGEGDGSDDGEGDGDDGSEEGEDASGGGGEHSEPED
jgi:hypothetical protein